MDQVKTGSFLKELRNEKGLTQEQAAEEFCVARRTISRWETGSNMPDLSMLVELAEFYDVDVREIIDGERKSEIMNEEVKETLLSVADYEEAINSKIKKRLFWLTICALCGMVAVVVIGMKALDTPNSVYEKIASAGLGLCFGMLIVLAMYLSGILGKIKARKMMRRDIKKN